MRPDQYDHISDHELLQRFYKDHDNTWLGILLPRYTLLLLGVCMKYLKNEDDARDCVQHVFFKVINELHKYKVDYFKSWIYMIAKNHCLMKLRDQKVTLTELNDKMVATDKNYFDKKEVMEKEQLLKQLQEAIRLLNPEQQQCVNLFYLEKKSYAEVADITGFTISQVKSYLQNGKRNLRNLLEKAGNTKNETGS